VLTRHKRMSGFRTLWLPGMDHAGISTQLMVTRQIKKEGLTRHDVETRYHDEYLRWEEDPFTVAPAGGECGVDVMARALPVIRAIVESHEGQQILVVSHKATIRLVISSFLGFDARGYRDRLDQAPACLNVIDFKDPVRARLMLFNDVSHYSNQPQSPRAGLSKWWDQAAVEPGTR